MAEYICKEDFIKILKEKAPIPFIETNVLIGAVSVFPSADVAPVVHGKNLKEEWSSLFECSICHWSCWDTYCNDTSGYDYCPNCGAKMDGET